MTAIDCPMPIVVQQRRREESAVGSSGFIDFDLTAEKPLIVEEGKFRLISGNSNSKNSVRREWRVFGRQNSDTILYANDIVTLPEPYFIVEEDNPFESKSFFQAKTSIFPEVEKDNQEKIEEAFLRGFQPIIHEHKVLFSQEIELKTSELKRWQPNIVINPILLEDDE